MRPLNRPMFRYGGPIKEGVMSGIREPKKTGGSMGNLVGSPAYPKTDGREHHFAVSGTIAGLVGLNALRHGAMRYGARYLPRIWQGAKRIFGKTTPGGVQTFSGPQRTWNIGKGFGKSTPGYTKDIGTATFKPNWLGRDPLVQSLGWAGKTLTSGPAKSIAGKVLQFGASPTTLIGGLWYANGRWFNKDGSPANKKDIAAAKANTVGPQHPSNNPDLYGGLKTAEDAAAAKIAKQKEWNNRIKKYRDIMDIKGMNKEAAYKSLIDASKLVSESGDFKGDIKSGKLINQVIQAASKQFDKPKKTKDAIDTLILKGEIEADIAAGKPSTYLKTAKDMVATGASKNITEAMKTLTKSSKSMAATLGAIANKGIRLDEEQVGIAYRDETGNIPKGMIKVSEVNEYIEDNPGKNELDYVKDYMTKTELAPGDYIIGKRVVTVDENNKVSYFY